ncbi:MAG: putative metal-dependent hydrolase, TIM-barrel fold [Chloroflexi bacterium]|jgi:hypothetical protein|nr:MAG: putative metal-dependent hydrolase, TIM-barrel fold [Chloroflexota bacterium]
MPVVDADAHVDETDETWEYLPKGYERYKPFTVVEAAEGQAMTPRGYNRFWCIDGTFWLRRNRDDERTGTVVETRELLDIDARLRHMDELGIDIQVCYPTLFLWTPSEKPEVEYALTYAYNRWMGAKWAESNNRLRWVAMLPMFSPDKAIEEMRWAREHGACAIYRKGVEAGLRSASDPYFFPIYKEAEALDMAVCFHTGVGSSQWSNTKVTHLSPWFGSLVPIDAFLSLVIGEIPDKFPKLRWGFIEAMSSWIPYALADLQARDERPTTSTGPFNFTLDVFKEGQFFVACQTVEDLPYILQRTGDGCLVAGTDYTHADQSAEIQTLNIIRTMGDEGYITADQARKIREDNAVKLYAL